MNQPSMPPSNQQAVPIRPAVPALPDGTRGRRRTSSIVPAIPHHLDPTSTYHPPPHPAPPPPPPPSPPQSVAPPPPAVAPVIEPPRQFIPPLPWYSAPGEPFPGRRRRRRRAPPARPASRPPPAEPKAVTPATTSSDIDSTYTSTPSSTAPPSVTTSVPHRPVPALPLTPPAVPVLSHKPSKAKPAENGRRSSVASSAGTAVNTPPADRSTTPTPNATAVVSPPAPPKSWAALLQPKTPVVNGTAAVVKPRVMPNGQYGSLAEALSDFRIEGHIVSTPFLEPRGLVNTGNMCFMNAVLQMLVFCGPFYFFLDRIGKGAARNFKDDTPLIEALIMFVREFRTIQPANSKLQLKTEDLEAFGEPFTPEFVYEALSKISKFSHMRRGHQQDAEEFLGFLLDGLHEEALKVMKMGNISNGASPAPSSPAAESEESGWMEVGHKQKAANTRTTEISESPITKIFGGHLRSEFRVPGLKPSVTLEPYTPLQLDIQAPDVKSVVGALKHLTTPEKLQGDFKSPRGPDVIATKQVHIETLPPVLILHMKRFQYDNTGGTHKIAKKLAYPLQLDIPREAMSPLKRQGPQPKYKLIGVVYHHGKSASGGHYTVDVLRQDGKSWIRLDDKIIKRVREDEVAVDIKDIGSSNDFDGEEREGWVNGWEEANGSGGSNGPKKGEGARYVGKDDKVAYILFYQRI